MLRPLLLSACILTTSACVSSGPQLSNYYYDHPAELQRALNRLAEYQDEIEQRRMASLLAEHRQWLYSTEGTNRVGERNAPTQVAMFSDYNCAVCKTALKSILADPRIANGSVSVVVHELPILSATSIDYARLSHAAAVQGRFVEFLSGMIATDHLSVDVAARLAAQLGIDVGEARRGRDAAEFEKSTSRNLAFFKAVGGSGTPLFVTHDGVHRGWNVLKKPF